MISPVEGTPHDQKNSYLYSAEFGVEFNNFWGHIADGMEYLKSADELALLRDEAIEKEHSFYAKVFNGVVNVMDSAPGEVICLFDIDNTITELSADDSAPLHKLLRPAFKPVVSKLAVAYPEILRFGLLTLLSQESIRTESLSPTFLTPARPYMDEKHFYSSDIATKNDPLRNIKTEPRVIASFLDTLEGIIDPDLLAATRLGQADFDFWYDPKLKVLADLSLQKPETIFILVDDLKTAGYIDPNNDRIKGICVHDEIQRLLP